MVTSSSSSSPPPNSSPHTSDASVLSAVSSGGDVMANYLPEGDENYRLMTPGVSLRSGPSRATSGGSSSSRDGNYRLMTPGVSLRSGSSRATSGGSSSSRDASRSTASLSRRCCRRFGRRRTCRPTATARAASAPRSGTMKMNRQEQKQGPPLPRLQQASSPVASPAAAAIHRRLPGHRTVRFTATARLADE